MSARLLSYIVSHLLPIDLRKGFSQRDVPDPYYGGNQGFENVLNMVEDAGSGLLEEILARNIAKG